MRLEVTASIWLWQSAHADQEPQALAKGSRSDRLRGWPGTRPSLSNRRIRKFKFGEHLRLSTKIGPSTIPKRQELIYEDAELVHDKTTIDLLLAFFQISQPRKKRNLLRIIQTILRDEYKIEDMMVIRKRVLDWTRPVACRICSRKPAECPRGYYLFFGDPRVNQTQELDPRARGEFRDILSHGKKEENQEAQS